MEQTINIPDVTFSTNKPPDGGPGVITMDQELSAEPVVDEQSQYTSAMDQLNAQHALLNIAEELTEEKLGQISEKVLRDYTIDLDSTSEWRTRIDEIIKYAKLLTEVKTWGGEVVANVRYPMIAQGAINFNARAYPEIVKGKECIKFVPAGLDNNGLKAARGDRLSQHMNYQVLTQMEEWEEEEDKLLLLLPVMGCAFKKTYYDAVKKRNVSELVFPDELVVNYFAKNLETASRITHIIKLTKNDIVERINSGVFLDIDIDALGQPIADEKDKTSTADEDAPHTFLEQHRYLDLDGDGYEEPYVVTMHRDSRKVIRIAVRYDLDGIELSDDGKTIIRIEPVHYFTRFPFMPSIDGGFYCEGFGTLMLSMNEAVDDGVNQLLDAGSSLNRPSGFLAEGVNLGKNRGGTSMQLKRGEWKPVQNSGDDLRKGIVEAPVPKPSPVTLNLLKALIDVGKEMTMSAAILSGEAPGANVPAATTLALIEQGLKPISGVFKRIYRAHKLEFKKLVRLNRLHLDPEEYQRILDDPAANKDADYNSKDCDVSPVLDPANAADSLRIMKAQALMQVKGQGFNDDEINRRYVESLNIENTDKLMPQGDDPAKASAAEMAELAKQKIQAEINLTNEQAATQRVDQFVKLKGVDFDKAMLILKAAQTNITMNKDQKQAELKGLEVQGKFMGDAAAAPGKPGSPADGSGPGKGDNPGLPAGAPPPSPGEGQPSAATEQGPYVEKGMRSNNQEAPGMPASEDVMSEGL